jgi:3-hydroxyacyl-[acyl-carrier-protein] dehydratase
MSQAVMSTRDIEAVIPHRWPFLLVDRIVEYAPEEQRIVGEKAVTATEWYMQGHFPGLPVMPGVLQVEALAQTMAVYVAKQPGFGDTIGLFAEISDCRFKRVVQPGDRLTPGSVSATVGTPGTVLLRFFSMMAISRSLPAAMCGFTLLYDITPLSLRPAATSVARGADPL